MINQLFYSENNKNAIKSTINNMIEKDIKVPVTINYDNIILDTMKYVTSQVRSTPPDGMKKDEYIFLMNKKVYDIVKPIIQNNIINIKSKNDNKNDNINNKNDNINNKYDNKKEKKVLNNDPTNLFDPILLKQFESPVMMDYPTPSNMNKELIDDNKLKSIENDRSTLIPKLKPIDFTVKDDNKDKPNTMLLYNELLTNYTSQINNIANQSVSNQTNHSTPIELLKNIETPIETFNETYPSIEPFSSNSLIEPFSSNSSIEPFSSNSSNKNNFNNDIQSYTRNQIQKLEFSQTNISSDKIIYNEPKYNLIDKTYYLIFDSKDRDLYEYPNPTSFQIKFNPAPTNYIYNSIYDEYNTLIINEKTISYGGGTNGSVGETFDNIKKISCLSALVPTNIITIGLKDTNKDTGIPTNIFKEPYLFLVVPEIKGPYRGGNLQTYNAFSKLLINYGDNKYSGPGLYNLDNAFTCLYSDNEQFIYEPVKDGKLDKMTLKLLNRDGIENNFGIDKLYVESFSEGTYRYNGVCGDKFLTTIVNIQYNNDEYTKYCSLYNKIGPCNILNNHSVTESDLLYFYNTLPDASNICFLEDNINVSKLKFKKNGTLEIFCSYQEEKEIFIHFKNLIPGGVNNDSKIYMNYYIVIYNISTNKYYYLRINSFTNQSIIVDNLEGMPQFKNYSSLKVGILKNNLMGINDQNRNSLFSVEGNYVTSISVNDNIWSIEINYPYNLLPSYLKDKNLYYPGNIFFIQSKLQINYTFSVTISTKDYHKLESYLNESGSN